MEAYNKPKVNEITWTGIVVWATAVAAAAGAAVILNKLIDKGYIVEVSISVTKGTFKITPSPRGIQEDEAAAGVVPEQVTADWNSAVEADAKDNPTNEGINWSSQTQTTRQGDCWTRQSRVSGDARDGWQFVLCWTILIPLISFVFDLLHRCNALLLPDASTATVFNAADFLAFSTTFVSTAGDSTSKATTTVSTASHPQLFLALNESYPGHSKFAYATHVPVQWPIF